MNDLKEKLERLSLRGQEAGTERLRDRVLLELAGANPQRVGRTAETQRIAWLGVAAVGVVAIIGVAMLSSTRQVLPGSGDEVASGFGTTTPPFNQLAPAMSWDVSTGGPGAMSVLELDGMLLAAGTECGTVDGVVCATEAPVVYRASAAGWEQLDAADAFANVDAGIRGIASGPDGLVAIGTGPRPGTAFQGGIVWHSSNGFDWTRIADDEGIFVGSGFLVVEDVAVGGPGFVAVGWDNPGGEHTDAIAWISNDGLEWERIIVAMSEEATDLITVAASDSAIVASGTSTWWSSDGREWFLSEGVPGFTQLIGRPNGGFAGLTGSPDATEVWVSEDGESWSFLGAYPLARESTPVALASFGDSVLVIATDPTASEVLAIIVTGDEFETIELDRAVFAPGESRTIELGGMIYDGDSFTLLGDECSRAGDDCDPRIWRGRLD